MVVSVNPNLIENILVDSVVSSALIRNKDAQ